MILVKVEALNIYPLVYAANDLGAIRGSGLSLLRMPFELEEWLKSKHKDMQRIMLGASKATFVLKEDHAAVQDIQSEIKAWLCEHHGYATIGVACATVENGQKILDVEEKLQSAIRLEQMTSFSFARPSEVAGRGVCELDRVRPACKVTKRGEESLDVCKEVFDFRRKGYDLKRELLQQYGGAGKDFEYPEDLTGLSTSEAAGRLNGKMAIFYADGNGFGSKPRKGLSSLPSNQQIAGMQRFDAAVQEKRKQFLSALIQRTNLAHWQTDQGKRRIEVLLWGGDELMLVVPAWCGWETAELFASTMRDSTAPLGARNEPLKYAMGLIFAHHKAPIHALAQLIKHLAEDEAKEGRDLGGSDGRNSHRLSYLVLESFDHVGEDLGRFRELQWRNPAARKGLVLSAEGENLRSVSAALEGLKSREFPRRKVYEIVKALNQNDSWETIQESVGPYVERKEWAGDLGKWQTATGNIESSWCHLVELWDYVSPELRKADVAGGVAC